MSECRGPAEAGAGATAPDPLAATLPLLRALAQPAALFRPEGAIVAASPAMEELFGGPADGITAPEFVARLGIRYPTGRDRSWSDLCRALARERTPSTAIDIYDSSGRFHAMVATASRVGPKDTPIGVLIVFSEITQLIERSAALARASPAKK